MRQGSKFQHQSLDLSTQQIRLVKLIPLESNPEETIELAVEHYNFHEVPPYTALSYAWGPPTPVRTIHIDGRPLQIRENLWQFLCTGACPLADGLCQADGFCLFWIDQLCIDQQNDKEKGHQVQFMGEIFSKAQHVIAWLGPGGEDSYVALDYMSKFGILSGEQEKLVLQFFAREYWSRLWVIQELALATRLSFMCGMEVFGWRDFYPLCTQGTFAMNWRTINQQALWSMCEVKAIRRLDEVIVVAHSAGAAFYCQQHHDMIYGLMGLIPPAQRVPVDYSKEREALLWDVLDKIMPNFANDLCTAWRDDLWRDSPYLGNSRFRRMYDALRGPQQIIGICCRILDISRPKGLYLRKLWTRSLDNLKDRPTVPQTSEFWPWLDRALEYDEIPGPSRLKYRKAFEYVLAPQSV